MSVAKRVLNTECSVAEQLRFAKQRSDSPHLHHVVMDYAKFAFKTSLKAHLLHRRSLSPQNWRFAGSRIEEKKNSFIFLRETLEEWKCSLKSTEQVP